MARKKYKIIISVINDLVTDQRVNRVAQTLHEQGHEILLLGRLLPHSLALNHRDYQTKRMVLLFKKGPLFYAEMNIRLFFFLLTRKFDVALSNDLDTLTANYLVCKIRRKILVYDSHEIFTQVPELIHRKFIQKIWIFLEKRMLPEIKHAYTVNYSLSEYYNKKYNINMQVIRNVPVSFSSENVFDESNFSKRHKIIVYQGALNVGRGLELMIKSMQYLSKVEFMIIGDGDIKGQLMRLIDQLKLKKKIKFLGRIPFDQLKTYTMQADLGVSLEEDMGLNYHYALPNKIFDYIHAGIPVLASNLPEMSGLIEKYGVGVSTDIRNPEKLARLIENIFEDIGQYKSFLANTLKAKNELCWEKERVKLIEIFNNLE